jgi:hypothetical protein
VAVDDGVAADVTVPVHDAVGDGGGVIIS